MFIKVTNATSFFEGKEVIIRTNIIVTVYESEIDIEGADIDGVKTEPTKKPVTIIYCSTDGTWHVKETVNEIFEMLK